MGGGKDEFMRKYGIIVLQITIILFLANYAYAQTPVIKPTVKTPFPVYCLSWNRDGSSFSYAETGTIVVRKTSDYSVTKLIETNSTNIMAVKYASSITDKTVYDRLVSLSSDNALEGRALPDKPVVVFNQGSSRKKASGLAISQSGDYIAVGMADGSIELYMWYFSTNSFTRRNPLQTSGHSVYAVAFSRDSKWIAAATDKNSLMLFDVSSGVAFHDLPYNSALKTGIEFTEDSTGIITASDEDHITIYNFDGTIRNNITVEDRIKSFQLSNDGSSIIVLTKKDQLRLYNVMAGKQLGYIMPLNNTEISSYSLSPDNKSILVGHKDGSIYLLKIREFLLDPFANPPKYIMGAGAGKETPPRNYVGGNALAKDGNEIPIKLLFSGLPEPYTFAISAAGGYYNFQKITPFYFGGLAYFGMGFPQYKFPNNYYLNGVNLESPFFLSTKLLGSVGFTAMPLSIPISLFTQIDAGLGLNIIWDRRFGKDAIFSSVFASFTADAKVGLAWKFLDFALCGFYDSITGFSAGAELGFNIRIKRKGG